MEIKILCFSIIVGTTTRRQYASWLAEKEKQRKESHSQSTTSKPSSVIAKRSERSEDDANPLVVRAADETSSEHTDEQETEDMDHDGKAMEEEDWESDQEEENNSGSPQTKSTSAQDSFRRPGRPRKSQAALKAQQAKKKYQKQRRPGRAAVKNSPKKKTHEWLGVLDMMHQQIVSAASAPPRKWSFIFNLNLL